MLAIGKHVNETPPDDVIQDAARTLYQRTGKAVFVTRGSQGMLVTAEQGQVLVPAVPVQGPLDICGAGIVRRRGSFSLSVPAPPLLRQR